jgi:hypothetical protein
MEGGAAAAALFWVSDPAARGVVVVAELFLAEAWARTAVAVGEDVAALVLFGCFGCVLHSPSPGGTFFVQSLRKRRDESGLRGSSLAFRGLNTKARLLAGPLFSIYFNSTELSETKFQFWWIYFFPCR